MDEAFSPTPSMQSRRLSDQNPYCGNKDNDGENEFGSFLRNPLWLPNTPSTMMETPTSTLGSSTSALDAAFNAVDFDGLQSISGLIVPEINGSDEDEDDEGNEEDDDFQDAVTPSAEFGDFNVAPPPRKLKDLVQQFTKVLEEEEKFVQLYKQNFQSDPSRTRKVLSANGFEFRKAKMVRMLSSRVIREQILEDEIDSTDDLSVVMSVCTTNTGRTGYSEATSNTAARLLERLKDPTDHDSVMSKELKQLSPQELAERFVEMQEKLASVRKKKKAKKKRKKKKKKAKKAMKKKRREEEEARRQCEVAEGKALPRSILKVSESLTAAGTPESMAEELSNRDAASAASNSVIFHESVKKPALKNPPAQRIPVSGKPTPNNPPPTKRNEGYADRINPLTRADPITKPKPFWKRMLPKKPSYSSDLPKKPTYSSASSVTSRDSSQQPRPSNLKKGGSIKSLSSLRTSGFVRNASSPTPSQKIVQRGTSSRCSVEISWPKSPRHPPNTPPGIITQASREPSELSLPAMAAGGDSPPQFIRKPPKRESSGELAARQLYARSLVSGSSDSPCPIGEATEQPAGKLSHAMVGGSSSVCSTPQRRVSEEDEDEVLFLF